MAIADTLKSKAGPLPVWAWGTIIGVLIVAATYYFRSRSAAGSASAGDDLTSVAYPDVDSNGLSASPSVVNASGTADEDSGFYSNDTWFAAAIAWGVGQGIDPLTMQAALTAYLNGDPITTAQSAIINRVVAKFGFPPTGTNGVSPISNTPVLQDPAKDTAPVTMTPVVTQTPPPANVALSPVGTALWNQGVAPPVQYGQAGYSKQAEADYGKSYEAEWERQNALKK